MKKFNGIVRHDPENGSYGDCFRACVASILDCEEISDVPHFFFDGCSGDEAFKRLDAWAMEFKKLRSYSIHVNGETEFDTLLTQLNDINPGINYILFGSSERANHCIVCGNGEIIHNPTEFGGRLIGPTDQGTWTVVIFVPAVIVA